MFLTIYHTGHLDFLTFFWGHIDSEIMPEKLIISFQKLFEFSH